MWVTALVAAGYQVYAINPMAAARYRDRHHVSGAESDTGDAKLLADLVRTDRHNHRRVAGDSADVEAVKVLARAHQNLIWTRNRHTNTLRSALRQYYPARWRCSTICTTVMLWLCWVVRPPRYRRRALVCRRFGLHSKPLGDNATSTPEHLRFRPRCAATNSPRPPRSPSRSVRRTRATVGIIAELNRQIADLEAELATHFETHPDADIYRSLPGLGVILGARVLGEFGDDPDRYTTAKFAKITPEHHR